MATEPKQGLLQTFTIMAIAFGFGIAGAYALDLHKHTCKKCGHSWRHLGAFNVGDIDAHTCPKCGTVEWWKNFGSDGAIIPPKDRLP